MLPSGGHQFEGPAQASVDPPAPFDRAHFLADEAYGFSPCCARAGTKKEGRLCLELEARSSLEHWPCTAVAELRGA